MLMGLAEEPVRVDLESIGQSQSGVQPHVLQRSAIRLETGNGFDVDTGSGSKLSLGHVFLDPELGEIIAHENPPLSV